MEYRQLYYFVCVAKEGNFTRAAEKLMISEPSLSKAIKRLEEELGGVLAIRSSRSFILTDFGKILYERGLEVIQAFEELDHLTQMYFSEDLKKIRIGMPQVLNTILAVCIIDLVSEHSHVNISLIEEGSKVIQELLLENKIDAGFVIRPVDEKYFDITDVISDKVVAIMSDRHPLADRAELNIMDIKDEPLILLNSNYQIYFNLLDAFCAENIKPNIVSTSSSWDFIMEIVSQSSKYITLLPQPILEKTEKKIIAIPLKEKNFSWDVVAIVRKGDYMPMIMKKLIKSIKAFYCQ